MNPLTFFFKIVLAALGLLLSDFLHQILLSLICFRWTDQKVAVKGLFAAPGKGTAGKGLIGNRIQQFFGNTLYPAFMEKRDGGLGDFSVFSIHRADVLAGITAPDGTVLADDTLFLLR